MTHSTIARDVSRTKAVRLVAGGRLIACSIALTVAAIGVAADARHRPELLVTGAWWLIAAFMAWQARREAHPRAVPLALVFDLVLIAVLLMTTGGIGSVYFPLIVMPPFAANLLYGRRVILWAAGGGVAVYVLTLLVTRAATDPRLMIMRFGVVLLLGMAVLRRAAYEERVHRDIELLATWPRSMAADHDAAIREMLQRAARMLGAARAAMAWSGRDGAANLAQLSGERFEIDDDASGALVAPELEGVSAFLTPDLCIVDGVIERWSGPSLAPAIAARFESGSLIGARLVSQTVSGWLYAIDVADANADDLMLAQIIAGLVGAGLDQINLAEMMQESAAADERLRLSRDLHDGLLQSLSGLALHAQAARRSATRDPHEADQRLGLVVEQLGEAQRALRDFVDELRPDLSRRRQPLAARLQQLGESIERQWGVPVSVVISGDFDAGVEGDIAAIVAEGLTNAAKHAGATRIEASVSVDGDGVRVDVIDDGRGFPFHGRYELPQLVAEQRGPWSLKERVSSLGGELAIDSSSRGSRVEVRLPRAS
jgi:signal transduction histidine kinase